MIQLKIYEYDDNGPKHRYISIKPITAQTFLDAADIIEKEGLQHGKYISQEGCGFCTVGGIAKASELPIYDYKQPGEGAIKCFDGMHEFTDMCYENDLINKFAESIKPADSEEDHPLCNIYIWSDSHSKEDVVATLRKFGNEQKEKTD